MNRMTIAALAGGTMSLSTAAAQQAIETFDGGVFTEPRIQHDFEFPAPMWEIVDPFTPGNFVLHLIPNTDRITFDLPPGAAVTSVRFLFRDHEVTFNGLPSSTIVVRGSSGEFVTGRASDIMIWETHAFTSSDPAPSGNPLGNIVEVMIQAANSFQGAFIDNIEIGFEVACYPDCDTSGVLDVFDFLCFQDAFVVMAPYADCDGSTTFDIFDFLCFQDAFVTGCP
jgi:hypothetical protein